MWFEIALFVLVGLCSGFMAGLFGVGGGMVMVPILVWVFSGKGISADLSTHMALATSLAVIVPTSISSVRAHWRRDAVLLSVLKRWVFGLALGSLLGAWVAKFLPAVVLHALIALFAAYVSYTFLKPKKTTSSAANRPFPNQIQLSMSGGIIGISSAIFGIGGGTLSVPYLTYFGVPIQKAVGTAAGAGLPIAVAGMIGFIWAGYGVDGLPSNTLGFVYWPAVLGMSIGSVIAATFGAKVAHQLSQEKLRLVFGLFLILVSAYFVCKAMGWLA